MELGSIAFNSDLDKGICSSLYDLANTFNSYYQRVKILQGESDRLDSNITLLNLMKNLLCYKNLLF